MRTLLLMITTTLLVACIPEKPEADDKEKVDITTEHTVLSFSSQAQGDYPVVTNLSLNNPVSAHSIVATIPELFKLEQADELEQYLQASKALGFDREAFNNANTVAWKVIEAVRYNLMSDLLDVSLSEIAGSHAPSQKLEISSTFDSGARGKKRRYTYSIDQQYSTSHCLNSNPACSYAISLDLSFYFPNSGLGIGPNQGSLGLTWGPPMVIEIKELQISQENLKLNISPNGDNAISVSFGSEIYEGLAPTTNSESKPSTATSKLSGKVPNDGYLQPNSIAIPFSDGEPIAFIENWSIKDALNTFGSKGLTGTFTNSYVNENGDEKTVTLTGHIHADFPEYAYFRNFSVEDYTYPSFTEQDKPAEERSQIPLSINSMAGYLWNVDVEVQFATDITE